MDALDYWKLKHLLTSDDFEKARAAMPVRDWTMLLRQFRAEKRERQNMRQKLDTAHKEHAEINIIRDEVQAAWIITRRQRTSPADRAE